MIRARAEAVVTGALAALASPLWLRTAKLNQLLGRPEQLRHRGGDAVAAVDAALRTLRLLARLRLPLWRNTCLYRSIVECLVLRRYGVSCQLQIGVTTGTPHTDDTVVHAHAWVVRPDAQPGPVAPRMAVLSR